METTTARCNLIIDSCCDLPPELVGIPGVELVSFPYRLSDGEHFDDLFVNTSAHDFYEGMRKGEQPTTAQMPLAVLVNLLTRVMESGEPTVFLCFSSGLSGNFDEIQHLYDSMLPTYPQQQLYLVDTKLASIAEGLLVMEAIKQRDRGLSAAELAAWAEEARFYVGHQFMVEDLDSLKRGGRISAAVAFVGSKLDVKPLLEINLDGGLSLTGVARGRKKGIKRLAQHFAENRLQQSGSPIVLIASADAPKDLERLRAEILKVDETTLVVESSIGPVIGSHVGPGMLAVVFWGNDARKNLAVPDRIAQKVTSS